MFAQHPYQKSFAELFQKRPLAPAGASAFFFLELFLFVPLKAKRKSGARENVTLNMYIRISIAINFYLQIVTLSPLSFFLLRKEAQNENRNRKRFLLQLTFAAKHRKFASQTANCKGPKKKDAERGNFARCDERQGLRALDLRRLAGGGLSWVRCEHTANKNSFGRSTVRT